MINPGSDPANWNGNAAWLDQVIVTNIAGLKPSVVFQPPALLSTPDHYPVYVRTTGGNAPWWVETTNSYDGVMALRCVVIGDNQQSWLRTIVSGPDSLGYWHAHSTEIHQDNFFTPWGGYTSGGAPDGWPQEALNIPHGTYTHEWRYEKDASGSGGSDAACVDEVVWIPSASPRVNVTPQWRYPGETCVGCLMPGAGCFASHERMKL